MDEWCKKCGIRRALAYGRDCRAILVEGNLPTDHEWTSSILFNEPSAVLLANLLNMPVYQACKKLKELLDAAEERDRLKTTLEFRTAAVEAYAHGRELDLISSHQSGRDKPLPEDEAIKAAFPTRSGKHEIYAEAMRLVGAKHSKNALVALVNWLLVERSADRELKP